MLRLIVLLLPTSLLAYTPDWESLDSRPLPKWYDDAKIGIFMHWGPYAVPGYGSEWFWKQYERGDRHINRFVDKFYAPEFRYQELGSQLRAEFFNASQWAEIVEASGAKYYVLTSKHHDGFTLWPSSRAYGWNSEQIGPRRDIIGELAKAFEAKQDVKFGLYYSLFEWFHPLYLADKAANFTTRTFVNEKVWPEVQELVNKYNPHIVWTDGDWEPKPEYWKSQELMAWLYNDSPVRDTVITIDRWGSGALCKHGDVYTCADRFNPGVLQEHKWENAMTVDRWSWGYRRNMDLSDILSMKELLRIMAQTISCNGNLLVNVGPNSQGTIDPIFEERLRQMGWWLKLNGEAVYRSKPWSHQNDTLNENVWYTAQKNENGTTVYGILTEWPSSRVLKLGSPESTSETEIRVLGYDEELVYHQEDNITVVELPHKSEINSDWAWTLKLTNLAN